MPHCRSASTSGQDVDAAAAHATGDAEAQRILRLTQAELTEALMQSRFGEVKWTATVAVALLRLRQQPPRAADGSGT